MARTARVGPAGAVEYAGMAAGVAAPVALVAFVVGAGRYINADPAARGLDGQSYSHVRATMSELGDRHDLLREWFLGTNVFIALLLAMFTLAVFRRVPVGRRVIVLLLAAAAATALIGVAHCPQSCAAPPARGGIDLWHWPAHYGLALVTAAIIVALPRAASRSMPSGGAYGRLGRASAWIFGVAVAAALALLAALVLRAVGDVELVGAAERALWAVGYGWILVVSVAMFAERRGRGGGRPFDVTRLQENVVHGNPRATRGLILVGAIGESTEEETEFGAALAAAMSDETIRAEASRRRIDDDKRPFTVTIALTHAGLRRLRIPYRWTSTTADSFAAGMANRADILGDVGESHPTRWQPEWRRRDLHVLVWVTAESDDALARAEDALSRLTSSLRTRVRQPMQAIGEPGRFEEPFGFADGISQPWIEHVHKADDPVRAGGGKLVRRRGGRLEWRRIAVGEFILGEIDEGGDMAPVPEPHWLFEGATFLVVRKLEQATDRFHEWSREVAGANGGLDAEELEAKLVGRRRDGAPLAKPDPEDVGTRARNGFRFGTDPEGFACPLTAHVRRANPRDGLGFDGVPAHRRRMIRRGMPYHDPTGRGLMFLAFNARTEGQFEFVQSQWLNDGNAFGIGSTPDVVAASWDGERQIVVHDPESPTLVATPLRPFVTTRGGEYFVVPSISGLRALGRWLLEGR